MVILSLLDPLEEYDIRDAFETLLEDSMTTTTTTTIDNGHDDTQQEQGLSIEEFYTMYLGLGYCQPRMELDDLRTKVIQVKNSSSSSSSVHDDGTGSNLIVTLDIAFRVLSQCSRSSSTTSTSTTDTSLSSSSPSSSSLERRYNELSHWFDLIDENQKGYITVDDIQKLAQKQQLQQGQGQQEQVDNDDNNSVLLFSLEQAAILLDYAKNNNNNHQQHQEKQQKQQQNEIQHLQPPDVGQRLTRDEFIKFWS